MATVAVAELETATAAPVLASLSEVWVKRIDDFWTLAANGTAESATVEIAGYESGVVPADEFGVWFEGHFVGTLDSSNQANVTLRVEDAAGIAAWAAPVSFPA